MATLINHQLCVRLTPKRVGGDRRTARRGALRIKASFGDGASESGEPMHVPEDAFTGEGGQHLTPERKAATALGNLFTMAATRVILDQFTGTRHRSPVDFLNENPLRNGNEWLAKLMREPDNDLRITAMRIIETRRVFAEKEFDWEVLEAVANSFKLRRAAMAREETCEDTLEMTKAFLAQSLNAVADVSRSAPQGSGGQGGGSASTSSPSSSW